MNYDHSVIVTFLLKCVNPTEPPAMISKPIMDINVSQKEKATFECEVSRNNAEVKWFKVKCYLFSQYMQIKNKTFYTKKRITYHFENMSAG